MKKFFAIILVLVMLVALCVGCKHDSDKSEITVADVFRNFSSTDGYTTATATLTLPKGITVSSYDGDSDVFVTMFSYKDEESGASFVRYGFCSTTENYITPSYTRVVDIKGDYAIVLGTMLVEGSEENYLGVVSFRGANAGVAEFIPAPYAPLIQQMAFLDDRYLIVLGDKSIDTLTSAGYTYATIYDYSSTGRLLEVCRVANVDNNTTFKLNDGWLSAVKSASADFYNINNINGNGYLEKSHTVRLLTDESYVESYMTTQVYYMGNEWYIVSTTYATDTEYDGYEIPLMQNNTTYYTLIKSVRISMKSGKTFDAERVTMVSNKYTDSDVRTIVNAINVESDTDKTNWVQPYLLPSVPTSAIVQDGYSLVYYYYYYYNTENVRSWATSFQICDSDGNLSTASNLNLPVVYVDGSGLQNIDPNFKLPLRDVAYHTYDDGSRVTLIPLESDRGYENAFIHDGVIISYEERKGTSSMLVYMGATGVDGRRITEFEYDAISPFFGGYATASKIAEWADDYSYIKSQAFFRIGKDGSVTSIPDCYIMCNGVYITRTEDGHYGLKANSGTELIPATCELVSCTDYLLSEGKTFKTYVATVEDGRGVIYVLG